MHQASLSFTISLSLLKLMSIELVMPSKHLILCLLSSVFSSIKVFSNESAFHIRWPKYWSFSISPTNECSRLISFRIDYFDLLAVQGTLKSLLLHHSLKASVLQQSAFFMVQLSRCTCSVPSLSLVRLCNPTDCSTLGFPILHQLPEPTQTHVHCIRDAIQKSHPLSSPSPPAFILSPNQGLFQ